jgi:hypothetical protein
MPAYAIRTRLLCVSVEVRVIAGILCFGVAVERVEAGPEVLSVPRRGAV